MKKLLAYTSIVAMLAAIIVSGLMFSGQGFNLVSDPLLEDKDYNVIMVSVDPIRPDHMPCYGYHRNTSPNICGMAEEGYLFKNVYTSATWTLPAYTSLFTGEYPSEHDFYPHQMTEYNGTEKLLAEKMDKAGYKTAAFVGSIPNANLGHLREGYGLDRGFDTYKGKTLNMDTSMRPALRWISRHKDDNFFLMIHGQDAHAPYRATYPKYRNIFTENYSDVLRNYSLDRGEDPRNILKDIVRENNSYYLETENQRTRLTEKDIEYIRGRYDENIRVVDRYVGKLISKLEKEGIEDETVVIFTGAHGNMLGEKEIEDRVYFGQGVLDDRVAHVPLIVKIPGKEKKTVITELVQWFDVHPTILDIADVKINSSMSAESIIPIIEGRQGREFVVTEDKPAPGIAIRTQDWRYVTGKGPGGSLQNTSNLSQGKDLSSKSENVTQRFESYLNRWRIKIHER